MKIGVIHCIRAITLATLLALQGANAAAYNEAALAKAAQQAQADTILFARHQGSLIRLLSRSEQDEIIALMQFDVQGKLLNPAEVYRTIAEHTGNSDSIAYYYAAAHAGDGLPDTESLLDAYKAMLYSDYDAQAFALEQLARLSAFFDAEQQSTYSKLLDQFRFSLKNINIDHDQDSAEMCLRFSHTLQSPPLQEWSRHIHITPATLDGGVYRGDEICYRGQWQTTYNVTIDSGLQSDNGLRLDETVERLVDTGNRNAMLRFASRGQTIIAGKDAALTVDSANIDTVGVEVWTIPDENLSASMAAELLNPAQFDNWWKSYDFKHNARPVYRGEFDTRQRDINSVVASRLPLADMNIHDPGIYVVKIRDKDQDYVDETMAFSVAEAGLSAYLTDKGLWAELRDLRDFTPVASGEVVLYARDNAVLARGTTDEQGMVAFDQAAISGEGGAAPDHLLYRDAHSLAYLYLDHQGFDLSDKGLDDRSKQADIQSWLWLDRGIYRPDDEMHAMWLLRHQQKAYHERDLWLTLRRPDGIVIHEQLISPDDSGAYLFDYRFANTARLGSWQLTLALGKDAAVINQATVRVDAIRAQQIETNLATLAETPDVLLSLQADWLYGAVAKGLPSDGHWTVQVRDWPQYRGWQIGRHDETPDDTQHSIDEVATDDEGQRDIHIAVAQLPVSTLPLDIAVQADVHTPDGQAVGAQTRVTLKRDAPYVALRAANRQAQIALIDDDGQLQAQPLDWALYRVYRDGYWYYTGSRWQYEYSETRTEQAQGSLTTNSDAPSILDLPVDDGLWLLEVNSGQMQTAGSLRMEFGTAAEGGDAASPEALTITASQPRYKDGEDVVLNIRAPFDGSGSVKLAHGDIFRTYTVEFKDHEATLTFPWQADWEQGIWVLAGAWQSENASTAIHNPRAVGLTWIGTDLAPYILQPEITAPDTIRPDSDLTLTVSLPDYNERSWVNIAVVDEGLYRLAPPSFSDPLQAFFGKTPWALSLFDIWGGIIRQTDAAIAALRSGAGDDLYAQGLEDLPAIDTPLITYWSGPVAVVDGKVTVTIPVPQFHGKLRVMALAYDDTQAGIIEDEVIVSEEVVSELYMPPYLTSGDSAGLRVRLHNTTATVQPVTVNIEAVGLTLDAFDSNITLQPDEEYWLTLPFTVGEQTGALVTATINDSVIERIIDIRPPARSVAEQRYLTLGGGESIDLPVGSSYAVGGLGLNRQQIITELNSYPYYCSEQTTSRLVGALDPQYGTHEAVMNTQARLANLQNRNGGFGLWSGSEPDLWLGAYIGEVLLHAKTADRLSQPQPLDRLLAYLRESVVEGYEDEGLGYAYYVLAKAGINMQGAVIRYAESLEHPDFDSNGLETVLALYLYGEDERAGQLWERLEDGGVQSRYQSAASELAQRIARLHELSAYRDVSIAIAQMREELQAELDGYYSTQTLARLALLAAESESSTVEINGNVQTITTLEGIAHDQTSITNRSDHPLAVTISEYRAGDPQAQIEEGYRIDFTYTDRDGQPLDKHNLPLYQDVVIDATIYRDPSIAGRAAEIMFVYPYSAGEQGIPVAVDDDDEMDMPAYQENRDDRHIAAFSLEAEETELHHRFALRAVREGEWQAPGPAIEDMYRSDYKAQYPLRSQSIGKNTKERTDAPAVPATITLESLQ